MSEYIPLEIQAEILKRLPLKPLIQFRCVSKSFKCLIDSPDFIASFGVRHPHPDRFLLRYQFPLHLEYLGKIKYLTFVDNDNHSFVRQDFVPTIPDLVNKIEPFSSVVGSSHGLLCFEDSRHLNCHMVLLWNPSIRKSVGIHVPYMYDSPKENAYYFQDVNVIGFGVCPVTFDPTILNIKCIVNYEQKMKDMPGVSIHWEVRVFTLSTGTWSILSTNLPRESIRLRGSQVVIHRFIYWVAFDTLDAEDDRSQSHFLIMSFDLTTKEFNEINLPNSLSNRLCSVQTISKLRESLVVFAYHKEFVENPSVYSLWMMKEQGVNRSFTKLYNINLSDATINRILGFRRTGELILETQKYKQNAKLKIYKPNSKRIHNLRIAGDAYSFFMCSYTETLLLLDQSDGYIYSISNRSHK